MAMTILITVSDENTINSTGLIGTPTRAMLIPIRLTAVPIVRNFITATEASR